MFPIFSLQLPQCIEVVRDVLREEAAEVLKSYQMSGGMIYNG